MIRAFDQVASSYDDDFTFSSIGSMLRKHVWNYLDNFLVNRKELDVLELNSGTGEDAVYLGKKGHNVIATDISQEMIKIIDQKVVNNDLGDKVLSKQLSFENLNNTSNNKKYDLVFSNFGGLNCIGEKELYELSINLKSLLKQNGHFIAVVMSKFCLWETVYFLVKFKLTEAFRRKGSQPKLVNVGNQPVNTWYYLPKEFIKIFGEYFNLDRVKPIGISLPPPYLESFFKNRVKLLDFFNSVESFLNRFSFLSKFSDHFLIDLKLR